jgi:hypothetical protein
MKVNLESSRVCVSAFDMRFPKQESQSADADEHDDSLQKYR